MSRNFIQSNILGNYVRNTFSPVVSRTGSFVTGRYVPQQQSIFINGGGDGTGGSASSQRINDADETLFNILTEQPKQFVFEDREQKSSTMTIEWSYEHLFPTINGQVFNRFSESGAHIPIIHEIYIDILHKEKWINLHVLDQSANIRSIQGYDTKFTFAKPVNINQVKTIYNGKDIQEMTNVPLDTFYNFFIDIDNTFDIRVYGKNNAVNYPVEDQRALVYKNMNFTRSEQPSKPILVSFGSTQANIISLNRIDISNIEIGVDNSLTVFKIAELDISASTHDTHKSAYTTLKYRDNDVSQNISLDIGSTDTPLQINDISFNNSQLLYGTQYSIQVRAKNNDNPNFSEFSDVRNDTPFTQLPNSGGIGTTFQLTGNGITNTKTSICSSPSPSGDNLNNANVFYINKPQTTTLNFQTNFSDSGNTATLEITNANASVGSTSGYGKYIDNSTNLVSLDIQLDGSSKEKVTFGGWNVANTHANTNTYNIIDTISDADIYGTNDVKSGLRKKCSFQINSLQTSKLSPSSKRQTLTFDYVNSLNSGSNHVKSYQLYVDNLSTTPGISSTITPTVTSYLWCCGVKSVKTFSIDVSSSLTNINSVQMYIPGNRVIGKLQNNNTQISTFTTNITLNNNQIVSSGSYSRTNTITGIFFKASYSDSNPNITLKQTAYNLREPGGIPNTTQTFNLLTTDPSNICDYASFNRNGSGQIINVKTPVFYELSSIDRNTTVNYLTFSEYNQNQSTHQNALKRHTPEYRNGQFQTSGANNKWIAFDDNSLLSSNNFTDINPTYKYVIITDSGGVKRIGNLKADFSSINAWYIKQPFLPFDPGNISGYGTNNANGIVFPPNATFIYYVYGWE